MAFPIITNTVNVEHHMYVIYKQKAILILYASDELP